MSKGGYQPSKEMAQKLHFAKRFRERVGEKLDLDLRDRWCDLIRKGTPYQPLTNDYAKNEVVILDRQPKENKTRYTVMYKNRRWVLVWDMIRKVLVTIYEYSRAVCPPWWNYRDRKQAEDAERSFRENQRKRDSDRAIAREKSGHGKPGGSTGQEDIPAWTRSLALITRTAIESGPDDAVASQGGAERVGGDVLCDREGGDSVRCDASLYDTARSAAWAEYFRKHGDWPLPGNPPDDDRRLLGPAGELGRF